MLVLPMLMSMDEGDAAICMGVRVWKRSEKACHRTSPFILFQKRLSETIIVYKFHTVYRATEVALYQNALKQSETQRETPCCEACENNCNEIFGKVIQVCYLAHGMRIGSAYEISRR